MKPLIAIIGAGESGVGAAILAAQKGFEVFVSDKGQIKDTHINELLTRGFRFEEGKHSEEIILSSVEIIKSPGIPDTVPLIQAAVKKGIPVISEIEFAGRYTSAKIIGITGSNGKTTTTNLTYHLLKTAGINVGIGGNVGFSFAQLVAEKNYDWYVLELSSFQLDGIIDFKPDISILLNITPDHLDRYAYKMENYINSKFRIQMNQKANDLFIYNAMDPAIQHFLEAHPIQIRTIALKGDFYENGFLHSKSGLQFDMQKSSLKGPHNMLNAICAVEAALEVGASIEGIQEGLTTFINAPHRLEFVATIDGVDYINDSKATNVDSVFWALKSMEKPTVLILGGQDKGNDYTAIADLVKEKVKAIVGMGVDNTKITSFFDGMVDKIADTHSIHEAVTTASTLAKDGWTVLLSPACASFDLFKNYEHRGDAFKSEVLKLNS